MSRHEGLKVWQQVKVKDTWPKDGLVDGNRINGTIIRLGDIGRIEVLAHNIGVRFLQNEAFMWFKREEIELVTE